jgi:predicted aspartyl protease
MRFLQILFLFIVLFSNCTSSSNGSLKDFEKQLNTLLEQKNYFKIRDLLASRQYQLTKEKELYYKAQIAKAFGERARSMSLIKELMSNYAHQLPDSILVNILDIQAENYLYNYEYGQAAQLYELILTKYPNQLDSNEKATVANAKALFGSLSKVGPQIMHAHPTVTINSYRNKFNHLMTPVKSEGIEADFIFDTGANLSAISEHMAKKLNLKMIDQEVELGSSTKIKVQTKLAVADSFYVGSILFEQVVFLVIPDEQLYFPQSKYQIEGIIGFPLIHAMEEMQMHKDGHICIPSIPKEKSLHNLMLVGLQPVVKLTSGKKTLYFKENKANVEKYAQFQQNLRSGVGGTEKSSEYMLSKFPIRLGSKSAVLAKIPVKLEEYEFNNEFDGNLGQDLFMKFNTLIINFKYMYVDFE